MEVNSELGFEFQAITSTSVSEDFCQRNIGSKQDERLFSCGRRKEGRKARAEMSTDVLLPGIPDDLVVENIAPKVGWKALNALRFVSRGWLQAIRSRGVYNAKLRSASQHACNFLVLPDSEDNLGLHLYSMDDDTLYRLPPVPGVVRIHVEFTCLDGRLYVLGGLARAGQRVDRPTDDLHVLDIVGERKWMRCASMNIARCAFGCGAMDGKIYAVGGWTSEEREVDQINNVPVKDAEVYDPKTNVWSVIPPSHEWQFGANVTPVGDELFVCTECEYRTGSLRSVWSSRTDRRETFRLLYPRDKLLDAEVYHPVRREWRTVIGLKDYLDELMFNWRGALYKMACGVIDQDSNIYQVKVYNAQTDRWKFWRSFALDIWSLLPYVPRSMRFICRFVNCVVVKDTLFVLVFWWERTPGRDLRVKNAVIRSSWQAFLRDEAITWQKSKVSLLDMLATPVMRPLFL